MSVSESLICLSYDIVFWYEVADVSEEPAASNFRKSSTLDIN